MSVGLQGRRRRSTKVARLWALLNGTVGAANVDELIRAIDLAARSADDFSTGVESYAPGE